MAYIRIRKTRSVNGHTLFSALSACGRRYTQGKALGTEESDMIDTAETLFRLIYKKPGLANFAAKFGKDHIFKVVLA